MKQVQKQGEIKISVYPLALFKKHFSKVLDRIEIWDDIEEFLLKFERFAIIMARLAMDGESLFLSIQFKQNRYAKLKVIIRKREIEIVDAVGLE